MSTVSSSTSSTSTSAASSRGFSSLVSGMDTETMVKKLLSGTQSKIDKQKQKKQLLTWKQNIYRDSISSINSFKSKYLSYSSSSTTNLNSKTFFNSMSSTASSSAVKVTATTTAPTGKVTVNSITQLATYKTEKASQTATGAMTGTLNLEALKSKTLTVSVGGSEPQAFDISGFTASNVASELNTAFATKFGEGKVTATMSDGKLTIKTTGTTEADKKLTIGGSDIGLNMLGLTAGAKIDGQAIGTVDFTKGTAEYLAKNPLSIDVTLDGVTKKIKLNIDAATDSDFTASLNTSLQSAFGNGVTAAYVPDPDPLKAGKISFQTASSDRQVTIKASDATAAAFGMTNGQSNKMNLAQKLSATNFANGTVTGDYSFTINGVTITGSASDTLSSLMSKINSSDAGVKISYSSLEDKFSIASTTSGAGTKIDMTGGVLATLFGGDVNGNVVTTEVEAGKNALLSINGISVERNSNSFEFDGLQIDLQAKTDTAVDITTTRDKDKVYQGIKSFVEDYNTLISKLNATIDEEATYKDYAPLTDAQRKDMSETEITQWETKAKTGILRGDSDISSFLSQMRSALYTKPTGAKYALYDLGITTGDYKENGKLSIEDPPTKLMDALENDPQEVAKLFTDSTEGLSTKLSAIIDDTAKVGIADPGTLVRLAGSTGSTDTSSSIYNDLKNIKDRLETLDDQYDSQYERYWKQFNSMESMISKMNSQSSWLTSQFS